MESNFSKQSNISNEVPVTENEVTAPKNEVMEKVKEARFRKLRPNHLNVAR